MFLGKFHFSRYISGKWHSTYCTNNFYYKIKRKSTGELIEHFCEKMKPNYLNLMTIIHQLHLIDDQFEEGDYPDGAEKLIDWVMSELQSIGFLDQIENNMLEIYSISLVDEYSITEEYQRLLEGDSTKMNFICSLAIHLICLFDFLLRKEHPDITFDEAKPFYFDFEAEL